MAQDHGAAPQGRVPSGSPREGDRGKPGHTGAKRLLLAVGVIVLAAGGLYIAEHRHANYEMALMAARTAVANQQSHSPSWWEALLEMFGLDTSAFHSALPMNLRMARGRLTGASTIHDQETGFKAEGALRVQREIEMLQWTETKREGTANDKPSFSYSREWRTTAAVSSSHFADNRAKLEHVNPPPAVEARSLGSRTFSGRLDGIAVQNRRVSAAVASQIAGSCLHLAKSDSLVPASRRPRLPFGVLASPRRGEDNGWLTRSKLFASPDGRYWQSHPPHEAARVGDIRIRFRVSAPTHAAVIGGTGAGGSIDAWVAPNGETIQLAQGWRSGLDREVTLVDVLDSAHSQNTMFLVVARLCAAAATLGAFAVVCCTKHLPPDEATRPGAPSPASGSSPSPRPSRPPAIPRHASAPTEDPPAHVDPMPDTSSDGLDPAESDNKGPGDDDSPPDQALRARPGTHVDPVTTNPGSNE